jgi:hypothetical protein
LVAPSPERCWLCSQLHANEPVSAGRLALALWGEDAPASAVRTVQVHVSRLRKALGDGGLLATTPAGYRLRVGPRELDAERFGEMSTEGLDALLAGQYERAAAVFREALGLWRGSSSCRRRSSPNACTRRTPRWERERATRRRQRTLTATLDWSHDLLSPVERAAFAAFSTFAGGATADAAQAVTTSSLDVLEALATKSLIARRGERLSMLEVIRQYAAQRLAAAGAADAARERHARHYLRLAETAAPYLLGARRAEWLNRLEADGANLRAALAGLAGHRGDMRRSFQLASDALARAAGDELETGRALARRAATAHSLADARADLEPAIAAFRALGSDRHVSVTLSTIGFLAISTGAYEEATALLALALPLPNGSASRGGSRWFTATSGSPRCSAAATSRPRPSFEHSSSSAPTPCFRPWPPKASPAWRRSRRHAAGRTSPLASAARPSSSASARQEPRRTSIGDSSASSSNRPAPPRHRPTGNGTRLKANGWISAPRSAMAWSPETGYGTRLRVSRASPGRPVALWATWSRARPHVHQPVRVARRRVAVFGRRVGGSPPARAAAQTIVAAAVRGWSAAVGPVSS